jgi:hypothetical protein
MDIACPPGRELIGNDLAPLGPPRAGPDAALADVVNAFRDQPVAGYRYRQDQQGVDWVDFLGTAADVPKARVSVRHVDGGWLAVGIAACSGDYPAGLVAYPADRAVPPLASTADRLLVTENRPSPGRVDTLALQDRSGHVVWELPRIGAWYPTPLAWSPDGRRFLFQVSAGQDTATRVVMFPEGRDVAAPGALTWIGANDLLVWRDRRLGRLDVVSGAFVEGPPLTQYVSSQAGTRGRAALVIIPGIPANTAEQDPAATTPLVRFVDSALRTRDIPAPAGTVDCFSLAWTADGERLGLVCRRAQAPPGAASDTEVFEIDARTLRWRRLGTGQLGPVEQPLWSPSRS